MPGKQYHPLETSGSGSQYDRFREAAKQGDILDELVGLTLVDTGIRVSAMAHMQESWVKTDGKPDLHIPIGETCSLGVGQTGGGGDTSFKTRGEPCHRCQNRPDKDWAPDWADWHPKSKNGQRTIPIRNDDTLQVLESYFQVHDTVVGQDSIRRRVENIAERAGIERAVSPHDLRDTFGTRLALLGFTPYEIRDLMGHSTLQQALDYVKLSGAQVHDAFDQKWG